MHNNQIIQKIKNENIRPISGHIFLFRKIITWFLFSINTVFGAYAFAFLFLKILSIDFYNWQYLNNSYNGFLLENIPIIWVVLFVFSLLLMFYLFKKTNKGYRYSIIHIGIVSVMISFLLGILLAKTLAYKGLLVDRFEDERVMNWTDPRSGRVSGEVLFTGFDYVLIRDMENNVWNINTAYILDNSKQILQDYKIVSIIGKYNYDNNFTACQVIPLSVSKINLKSDKLIRKISKNNDLTKDICDFVIKND